MSAPAEEGDRLLHPPRDAFWESLLTSIATSERRLTLETNDGHRVVVISEAVLARLQEDADRHQQMISQVSLTNQEREVLRHVAESRTVAEAAQQLGLAASTVSQHLVAVRRKLRVGSTTEAIRVAADLGLLDPLL